MLSSILAETVGILEKKKGRWSVWVEPLFGNAWALKMKQERADRGLRGLFTILKESIKRHLK